MKLYTKFAILFGIGLALFEASVRAADLPGVFVKAPSAFAYPTAGGWFYGVSASGLGGTAAGNGVNGGTVLGGRFGLDAGYTAPIGSTFYFIEASVSAQGINGASASLGVSTAVNFQERFAVGVPASTWNAVLAALPGLQSVAMPSVPITLGSLGPSAPYVFGALYQDDVSATAGTANGKAWLLSYGAGVGILNRLSNGMMLDSSVEWKHQASGMLVGTALVYPFQDAYLATVRLKF